MKNTPEERAQKIEMFGNAYAVLTEALQNYPTQMWMYKPAPEAWSIHEIIIHLADSEVNGYVRCRRLIAQPGSDVLGYDQDAWAQKLDYQSQNTDEHLELLRLTRKLTYQLIKNQPLSVYETATIHHSERGWMLFDDWLESYCKHVSQHIEQMNRVYEAWKSSTKM